MAEADRSGAVAERLDDKDATVRAAALKALPAFPKLLAERSVRSQVADALADPDVDARVAAIRLVLGSKSQGGRLHLAEGPGRPALPSIGSASSARFRPSPPDVSDLRLIGVVSNGVVDENSGVREKRSR